MACGIGSGLQAPLVARPPADSERHAVAAGLRSADAVTLRRSQIVLARARGEPAPARARALGCSEQAVRTALHACNREGVAALQAGSARPHTVHAACDGEGTARLRTLGHRAPRDCGPATSVWPLAVLAETAEREGLTATPITGETVRATLARVGLRWRRAKGWIPRPDPAYTPKTGAATA